MSKIDSLIASLEKFLHPSPLRRLFIKQINLNETLDCPIASYVKIVKDQVSKYGDHYQERPLTLMYDLFRHEKTFSYAIHIAVALQSFQFNALKKLLGMSLKHRSDDGYFIKLTSDLRNAFALYKDPTQFRWFIRSALSNDGYYYFNLGDDDTAYRMHPFLFEINFVLDAADGYVNRLHKYLRHLPFEKIIHSRGSFALLAAVLNGQKTIVYMLKQDSRVNMTKAIELETLYFGTSHVQNSIKPFIPPPKPIRNTNEQVLTNPDLLNHILNFLPGSETAELRVSKAFQKQIPVTEYRSNPADFITSQLEKTQLSQRAQNELAFYMKKHLKSKYPKSEPDWLLISVVKKWTIIAKFLAKDKYPSSNCSIILESAIQNEMWDFIDETLYDNFFPKDTFQMHLPTFQEAFFRNLFGKNSSKISHLSLILVKIHHVLRMDYEWVIDELFTHMEWEAMAAVQKRFVIRFLPQQMTILFNRFKAACHDSPKTALGLVQVLVNIGGTLAVESGPLKELFNLMIQVMFDAKAWDLIRKSIVIVKESLRRRYCLYFVLKIGAMERTTGQRIEGLLLEELIYELI